MIRPTRRFWRRGVQIILAVGMALVPWGNLHGINWISGNYLALDAFGLPFGDPLAALQVFISARDITGRAVLGAGFALLVALILGPVFCAYACPYGLFSELVHALVRHRTNRAPRQSPARRAFGIKVAIVGFGLTGITIFGLPPLLNQLSMPAYYSRLWQHVALGGLLLPVLAIPTMLLVEGVFARRIWCRFLCPQSVLLALMRRITPWSLRLIFDPGRCHCGQSPRPCATACTLELDPRRTQALALACTNCGDCLTACQERGQALQFHLGPSLKNMLEKTDSTRPHRQL